MVLGKQHAIDEGMQFSSQGVLSTQADAETEQNIHHYIDSCPAFDAPPCQRRASFLPRCVPKHKLYMHIFDTNIILISHKHKCWPSYCGFSFNLEVE